MKKAKDSEVTVEQLIKRSYVIFHEGDYGSDPILCSMNEPTGFVKLIPSGRILPASQAITILAENRKNLSRQK